MSIVAVVDADSIVVVVDYSDCYYLDSVSVRSDRNIAAIVDPRALRKLQRPDENWQPLVRVASRIYRDAYRGLFGDRPF